MKDFISTILIIICLYFLIRSFIRLLKDTGLMASFSRNIKDEYLTEHNEDQFLKVHLFGELTKEQKYAYIYTLETFRTFADNAKGNDAVQKLDEIDRYSFYDITILYSYNLNLLNMTEDDIDKAINFIEDHFYLRPIDYLKGIKENIILDSLLYTCNVIAETKKGYYKGLDIHAEAKNFLFDYFGELGYSPEKIEQTLVKIDLSTQGNRP